MPGIINRILSPFRIRKLKRKYIELHRLSALEAEKALARQLTLLKRKHPGQTEVWYLEKVIYDLEKDRRR